MVIIAAPEDVKAILAIPGAVEIGEIKSSEAKKPGCYVCSDKGVIGQSGPWQTKPVGDKI